MAVRTARDWSLLITTLLLCFPHHAWSKAVFAHYMVGTVYDNDAHQDIIDAAAMGLDGFALNIGDATQDFVTNTLASLFGYAAYRTDLNFKLYVSMDLYAAGNSCYQSKTSCNGPYDYNALLAYYMQSSAYYRYGSSNLPVVSTFSSGGFTNTNFTSWKATLNQDIYFIPDFDETEGYYDASPDWYAYWGDVVDGIFSWESAWPVVGASNDGDVTQDVTVLGGATKYGKSYMMGLSFLQYKNSYGTNLYRHGELTLPKRMENILGMDPQPDFVQVLTWNDGPEGHYIGNLWPEQNNDSQPGIYANSDGASHDGLRSLISSFIDAFKNSAAMTTSEATPIGAFWYKTIFQSTSCPWSGEAMYFNAPNGSSAGLDALTWAVVVPPSAGTLYAAINSDDIQVSRTQLSEGFNYGRFEDTTGTLIKSGAQYLIIEDGSGNTVAYSEKSRCMTVTCTDGIYNFNPQVASLVAGSSFDPASCWQVSGTARADLVNANIYGISRTELVPDSNCDDIEGAGNLASSMWDDVNGDGELKAYFEIYSPTGSWIFDFDSQMGYGQSLADCVIGSPCTRASCSDIDNDNGAVMNETSIGTAWKYMVSVSASNLNQYLNTIYNAWGDAWTIFDGTQIAITSTFLPTPPNQIALDKQLLNGLATAITVAFGVAGGISEIAAETAAETAAEDATGSILLGSVAPVLSGIIGGVILDYQTATITADEVILESAAKQWINTTQTWIENYNDGLLNTATGVYQGNSVQSVFESGAFVSFQDIPILSDLTTNRVTRTQLATSAYQLLVASLVNIAWIQRYTYISCYNMTQNDFDTTSVKAGTNDGRLKLYHQGYGCYFQSAYPEEILGELYPYTENPPGWGSLSSSDYVFSAQDAIQSSLDSYLKGGFNYTASSSDLTSALTAAASAGSDPSTYAYSMPGLWNIPICFPVETAYPSPNDLIQNPISLSTFFSHLDAPDSHTQYGSFCDCLGIPDQNGVVIEDIYPKLMDMTASCFA